MVDFSKYTSNKKNILSDITYTHTHELFFFFLYAARELIKVKFSYVAMY